MRNKKTTTAIAVLLVISLCLSLGACSSGPANVDPTGLDILEEKVLIAEIGGSIEIEFDVEPEDAYPVEIQVESNDETIATAAMGMIDENGDAVTATQLQKEKDELAKDDKEAAEAIVIPTKTAIVTGFKYGECEVKATLGEFSDTVKVVVADKQVALTFDDGACPETSRLLEGLREEDVTVTFFVVGQMTQRDVTHEDALKQAIEDGHEIGNHTYNHIVGAGSALPEELKRTDDLIISLGGEETTIMRPPGGAINSNTRSCGKAIIMWSVDTMDWRDRDPDVVSNRILEAEDGDIVLLHDLHATSVTGALKAIPELKKQGFHLVTVTELLGEPQPNQEYKSVEKGQLESKKYGLEGKQGKVL